MAQKLQLILREERSFVEGVEGAFWVAAAPRERSE